MQTDSCLLEGGTGGKRYVLDALKVVGDVKVGLVSTEGDE